MTTDPTLTPEERKQAHGCGDHQPDVDMGCAWAETLIDNTLALLAARAQAAPLTAEAIEDRLYRAIVLDFEGRAEAWTTDHSGDTLARAAAVVAAREVAHQAEVIARAQAGAATRADTPAEVLERVREVLVDNGHADTCATALSPDAGYPCSCWKADLRAALRGDEGDPQEQP